MIKRIKKVTKKKLKPRGRNDKKFLQEISKLSAKANQGNEWWKIRSKHGRDTLFGSPQLLFEAFEEYSQWCKNNPDYATEWKGRGLVKIPLKRVLLMQSFLMYCGTHGDYWHEFKQSKTYTNGKEWRDVVKLIEQTIYADKYNGAANGLLNSNLIIRDLKLSENINMDVSEHRKAAADLFPDEKEFKNKK